MAAITLERLRKAFGHHIAIDDLSIEIADGELLVLLGPSGCGKTTTLNCIAGLEPPTSGRILFDAEDVTALPPHQRDIAMVFQSSLLYPHLTGRQNIAMSLKHSGLDREEIGRKVSEAAAIFDVEAILDKLPSELSGGERQRVATAKAIIRYPRVFLMDEPLGALDAALRLSLRSELVNLQKRLGTTMVFVTHDQTEAMTMGDRIAVMNAGRIEQVGTPDEIYNAPSTLFVGEFVGSPPMNFFTGRIQEDGDRPVFVSDGLVAPLPERYRAIVGADKQFVLGIRPQHLTVIAEDRPGALATTVFALERHGKESVVIMSGPTRDKVRAIVDPEFSAGVGDRLNVTADAARGFVFDVGTGRLALSDT